MKLSHRLIVEAQQAAVWLVIAVGLGVLGSLLIVRQSRLISQVIQAVFLENQAADQLFNALLTCLLLVGIRALFTWCGEVSAHKAALQIKLSLRRSLITHLYQLGPALMLETEPDEARTGELVNTASQGIESLEAYYSQYLPQLALSALVPLTYLFFIAPLDPLTAFILLVTAPLLPLFMYLIGTAAKNQTRRQWIQLSRMSAYFLEVLQGLPTLKALGCSREQSGLIDQVSEDHRSMTMSVLRITFLSALALEMIATLSTAVVAVEIGLRLLYGRLEFEQAFFILLLAPEFYLPLRLLGLRFHAGMAGVEAARRIFALLDTPVGVPLRQTIAQAALTNGVLQPPPAIHFEHVSFTYQDGRLGLDDATFDIPSGQVTVLAGESGAGKSTTLSLLLGFLHPESGTISVDGESLKDISWQAWRDQLAWVPQQPYIFSDTLSANISLFRPAAGPQEIQQAARLAHIDEFIQSQPEGYATQAAERGLRLSAGQAQRLALARAFIKDAPVVLLDEPGAHLDPETDALLQDSLNTLAQGRTVLVIAHKPPHNLAADQVIWLEEGRVKRIEKLSRHPVQPVLVLEAAPVPPTPQSTSPLPPSATSDLPTSVSFKLSTLQRLFRLLTPFRWRVASSVLLGCLTIGSSMGLMSTAAYLISRAALQPSIAALQVAIVGVRFFGLSRGVFRYLERLVTHDVTFRLLGSLRGWFFRAVEPLVPARTQDSHTGDLLQRAIGDITALEDFYVRSVAPPLVAAFIGLTACFFLARFDLNLVIFLAGLFLLGGAVLPALVVKLAQKPGTQLIEQRARLSQTLVDDILGMPDLLAGGLAQRQINALVERTRSLGRVQARLAAINGFQVSASRLLADLAMLGVLWLGVQLVNQHQLEGVLLGALTLLAYSSFEAFTPLPQAALHLSSSLAAADRLFDVASFPPAVQDPPTPLPLPGDFNLKVKNLTFGYEASTLPAVSNLSFSIASTRKLAIVGTSGAGKSTILNLLLRFWDYTQGEINLNDYALKSFAGDEFRKRISVLPQNPILFSGTLYDNLRLKSPHSSQTEIETAAQRACIHDWILTLPNGYQTWIGESGLKLSAGQRQRIALARVLLPVSPLLLLDEPTAHLDPRTEQAVMRGILETAHTHHASLLMVTHRLVGMQAMDEILVMQNGSIVTRGKHAELAALDGLYRKLWLLQN